METTTKESSFSHGRLENLLTNLSKCKIGYFNEIEECKKLREDNTKLQLELKAAREQEQSHRYHLMSSREMIGNLQETVSQLVYLKRDIKRLKEEVTAKDCTIAALKKENENILVQHKTNITELRSIFDKELEDISSKNENEIKLIQHDSDTQIAQFSCVIEELRSKIRDLEAEHKEKINVVVLEYEEKLQRSAAQLAQMQEQLARQTSRTDVNIDAYRRRLEELEEKLKQSEFKQYLAQTAFPSQYESQVERPYSRDPYADRDPFEITSNKPFVINKTPKQTNTLQVTYSGNKNTPTPKGSDKKGCFSITKKRKLYNEKDYQDF